MGKKRPKRKTAQPADIDRRAREKILADISKLVSEQDFDSIEEMNAYLQDRLAGGQPFEPQSRTPLQQAQDLMYQAWEASGSQRVKLARQALKLSPDCADAYVLLAETIAKSPQEAKSLYEQGVQASERALGLEFDEYVGHFWGFVETRPYMRARAGLAACMWLLGEREPAIQHYQEMLRLNPNDNQGIRYLLVTHLLELGRDDALKQLLDESEYADDASAVWLYSRALWLFRQAGASAQADDVLDEAFSFNNFVIAYLLGKKKLPKRLPPYMGFGDENEAIHYVAEALPLWRKTEGALEWLRRFAADIPAR